MRAIWSKPVLQFPWFLLIPGWITMQWVLFCRFGVKLMFDSRRYLSYADSMAGGTDIWQQPKNLLYSTYTFFLYFFHHLLKLELVTIIIIQVCLSGVAAWCMYQIPLLITKDKVAAFISALLFIAWPDLQAWNFYIHTESVYISTIIFLMYSIAKGQANNSRSKKIAPFLFPAIIFLRPNGFISLLAWSVAVTSNWFIKFRSRITTSRGLAYLLLLLLVALFSAYFLFEVFSPVYFIVKGYVIQGYKGLLLSPGEINQFDPSMPKAVRLLSYLLTHPLQFLLLMGTRLLFFLGQFRPYYTSWHNALILLYFIPVYAAAAYYLLRKSMNQPVFAYMVTLVVLQSVMAMIMGVDWDNRFVVPILPIFFVLAGCGFSELKKSYRFAKQDFDK
jgi:hypothetical protein